MTWKRPVAVLKPERTSASPGGLVTTQRVEPKLPGAVNALGPTL